LADGARRASIGDTDAEAIEYSEDVLAVQGNDRAATCRQRE
jgi:hypothetical protein